MLIENLSFTSDRRMRHLAYALQDAGYKVTVICPKGQRRSPRAFEVVQGVRVYQYPIFLQARGKWGYLIEYSWAFLCTAILIMVVWLREGFDIIHSANPPDIFFLLAWPYKLFGKKYVFDQHELSPEVFEAKFERKGRLHKLLLRLERLSYQTADLVISTNESHRDIAGKRGRVPDERSAIVRNGVDVKRFYKRPPRPELKEAFPYMAVYVGLMAKQDGVDLVIQAAHHLVHTYGRRDVLFAMLGAGESLGALQELSRSLKVEEVIRFVGWVSDEPLLQYLSTADVCLAPDPPNAMSQISTMTKIMEYMACACPIVSFDLLESRRSADEAAVYVPGHDPRGFAAALDHLLNDAKRREKMGEIGLERSRYLVGLDRSRDALLAAYLRFGGTPALLPSSLETKNAGMN